MKFFESLKMEHITYTFWHMIRCICTPKYIVLYEPICGEWEMTAYMYHKNDNVLQNSPWNGFFKFQSLWTEFWNKKSLLVKLCVLSFCVQMQCINLRVCYLLGDINWNVYSEQQILLRNREFIVQFSTVDRFVYNL